MFDIVPLVLIGMFCSAVSLILCIIAVNLGNKEDKSVKRVTKFWLPFNAVSLLIGLILLYIETCS
jgi:uncharacterized membrane protein